MTTLTFGTVQREWRRTAPFNGTFAAMPDKGAFAYLATAPNPNNFNGDFAFSIPGTVVDGDRVADMAFALSFFFVKNTTTLPPAIARIWGLSQAGPPVPANENAGPFLGVYLGEVEFRAGTAHGLPLSPDPPKNVLLDNWYMASRISVREEVALTPPGIRIIGNAAAGTGCSPYMLFDAMGFNRIVIALRFAEAAPTSGLGFFWRTL